MKAVQMFLLWCLVNVEAQEEGDDCIDSNGSKGNYKNINSCPIHKKRLKKIEVTENQLFCCVEKPGDISVEKCDEYYPTGRHHLVGPGTEPSLAKEFPHMAIIGVEDTDNIEWVCGGSLISPNFVLTAAHCLKSTKLIVRLGDLDISTDTDVAEPQQFMSKKIFLHPEYKRPSKYHDIGLIELERNVRLTDFVGIACLDTRGDRDIAKMTATGWGKTHFHGNPSSHLLKVDLDVVSHNLCKKSYENQFDLPGGITEEGQICAGGRNGDDTCPGDSGGPLQVRNWEVPAVTPVYYIVGVTSFGKACGLAAVPGVYTRVYNYLSWIESVVWSGKNYFKPRGRSSPLKTIKTQPIIISSHVNIISSLSINVN